MDRGDKIGAQNTRMAIIQAAMRGFGGKGFAATSTREIASLADTNIASIAYHFGGKEGLRTACAEHIVGLLSDVMGVVSQDEVPCDPDAAQMLMQELLRRIAGFLLLEPQAQVFAGFILREMAESSAALDLIYDGVFERVHRRVCQIWGIATHRESESEAVRLAVFALIGQVVYFRVARPIVMRRMDWKSVGPAERDAIVDTITRNLVARIDADRRGV